QTDPWAAHDAELDAVILERKLNAIHRRVGKDDIVDENRQYQHIQDPVDPHVVQEPTKKALSTRVHHIGHGNTSFCSEAYSRGKGSPLPPVMMPADGIIPRWRGRTRPDRSQSGAPDPCCSEW